MFLSTHKALISFWAIFKGMTVATVTLYILGTTFLQSMVIAVTTGFLGIIGIAVGAYVAAVEARKNRELLHDIKRNTDTNKRDTDTVGETE